MVSRRVGRPHPLGQLRQEVERLLSDVYQGFPLGGNVSGTGYPALNLWETDHELLVEAEVPGLKQEDLEISLVGNELTISGQRRDFTEQAASYHRRERATGPFGRTLRLPVDVDASKIEANLRDGVLDIRLPKAASAKPRKIQVNVAG